MRLTNCVKNRCLISLVILLLWVMSSKLQAQQDLLSKHISIRIENESLNEALVKIASASGIHFSYNPDILNSGQKVSINCENRHLERILSDLLGPAYQFKSRGLYVIILRDKKYCTKAEKQKFFTIKGTVRDVHSNLSLKSTTIYDMAGMQSTISNDSGYFIISGKLKTTTIALRCARVNYHDTVVFVEPGLNITLDIRLKPADIPVGLLDPRSAGEITVSGNVTPVFSTRFVPQVLLINSNNVFIPEKRFAQMSLIPTIGTNLKMSGSVTNHFSINILGGYSGGVSGFEAAGIFNLTRNYVKGLQVACVANIGADTVKGLQIAGLFNYCRKHLNGMQLAVVSNIAGGKCRGIQIGGLFNYAPSPGFQLGLFNIADTNDGYPMGFLNIIKGGYYSISFHTDDLRFYSFLIHTGTTKLYSIIGISARPAGDSLSWGINYGLGSHFFNKSRLGIEMELIASVININKRFDETTVSRVSYTTGLSCRLIKKIRVTAGPSFNMLMAKTHNTTVNKYISGVITGEHWQESSVNTRFDYWIGWSASLEYSF